MSRPDTENKAPPTDAQLTFGWSAGHSSKDAKQTSAEESPPGEQSFVPSPADGYGPGHPWHYLKRGDNAPPLPVEAIRTANAIADTFKRDLPKSGPKRLVRARELLNQERQALKEDCRRYLEIVDRGADALSPYDREIAHGGDLEMARASSLALTHNHIAWRKGRVAFLERELTRPVARGR